jgi:hypothetical protein
MLEHDPEKWVPVFGKDHAPAIDSAVVPSVLIPKFVTSCSTLNTNFGIERTLATYGSSAVLDVKFLYEIAAKTAGTLNPPH